MRVTKDPEVRRKELVEAAEELFRTKGCEETSVSDIVKKVGVAQGTFYYYFESKDDVLDAVLDHYLKDHLEGAARGIIADGSKNALQKLQEIVNTTLFARGDGQRLVEFLHKGKNMAAHQKYMVKIQETFVPLLVGLVEEGVREGVFEVPYPRETVDYLLVMFTYMHDFAMLSPQSGDYVRRVKAAEDIVARALRLKEGSLKFCP